MKRQIRQGVFETNSSSEHSIAVVAYSDYDRWKKGELVARSLGRKESTDPAGNFWSYIHNIEFAPVEQKDELNINFLKEHYKDYCDPDNGWRAYTSAEELIQRYERGILEGDMCMYTSYEDFMKYGFDGEPYCDHFSHSAPNGLKEFGTYYHT